MGSLGSNIRDSSKEGAAIWAVVMREWTLRWVRVSLVGSSEQ